MVSPEMQLAAVTEYAAGFGDRDLTVLTDMNVSGRKGRAQRPGFDALLSAIEAGAVSAVYSYSLSRLSRSVRDMMALADLCRAHGIPDGWALLTGDTSQALEIAKGYDLLGNTVLNGEAGEYISTRANRARSEGRLWGCWLCRLMDWITKDHCKNAE